jgi:hypothetical protein
MARLLLEKLDFENVKSGPSDWGDEQIRSKLRTLSIQSLRESGLLERIMMQPNETSASERDADADLERIANADAGSLLEIANELL